jgi:hypothetical protein
MGDARPMACPKSGRIGTVSCRGAGQLCAAPTYGPSTSDPCSRPAESRGRAVAPRRHQAPQRKAILQTLDTYDYTFTEWIYGNTALFPEEEPSMYPTIPLDSIDIAGDQAEKPRELVAVK